VKLQDTIDLVQIQSANNSAEVNALRVAVGYLGSDGTQKLCGDRCLFHIESGKYKDRCTLLDKDVVVPNIASCTYYAKGEPADKWEAVDKVEPAGIFTASEVGLVIGKVQCKRCIRKGPIDGVCQALTTVLKKVLGLSVQFTIEGDACCNWNKSKGQRLIK
jgi:hypothetical protein